MINTKDIIGLRKYNALKKFDFDNMSAEEMVYFRETFKISVAVAEKKVADYELRHRKKTTEETEYAKEYNRKLLSISDKRITKVLTPQELWISFLTNFREITRKELIRSDDFLKNIEPIFHYFTRDFDKFIKCERVSKLSIPDLNKGLLIVGDFGNGKSTIMNVLELSLRETSMYFKGYSANEVVLAFEGCESPREKEEFVKRYSKGVLYFDDIKSERMASNYGKTEIFKEIIENRYNNKATTFITCNYKKGYEGDLEMALEEFGSKYGSRVYDRLYELFNIIEFKGKSFRK
jgi:DNA replication protein DnaC